MNFAPKNILIRRQSNETFVFPEVFDGSVVAGVLFRNIQYEVPVTLRYLIWYRKSAGDSLIITQNILNNMLLNFYTKSINNSRALKINVVPFIDRSTADSDLAILSDLKNSDLVFSLLIGVLFVVIQHSEELVRERTSKIKHLLVASKVHMAVYFLTKLSSDWSVLIVAVTLSCTPLVFWSPSYLRATFILPLLPLAMLYIASIQLFNYILTYFFPKPEMSTRWLQIINMGVMLSSVFGFYTLLTTERVYSYFLVFCSPFAAYASGIRQVADLSPHSSLWSILVSFDYVVAISALMVQGSLCLGGLVYLEFLHSRVEKPSGSEIILKSEILDDDVSTEKLRMQNSRHDASVDVDDTISVYNVQKRYGKFLAVNRMYFGVKRGECFGLLGPNGAGKVCRQLFILYLDI